MRGNLGTAPSRSSGRWLAVVIITAAVLAAYANSFRGVFVFDDDEAIVNNPAIRQLWPPQLTLLGEINAGTTLDGRPLLALSFALNYAVSGGDAWSYHALNLAIHLGAALSLLGLLRWLFRAPGVAAGWGAEANAAALLAALLWAVHPLQTESVTYIVQRAESLTAGCYLLTLLLFVRGATSANRPASWLAGSLVACIAGMVTKETMVSAPVMVLLFDRTFVAGSFRAAWRARASYYVLLAATWLPLAWLVVRTGGRGDSAGFDTAVTAWSYLLTQCKAVVHYLRLSVWPHPLALDYGTTVVRSLGDVWWQACFLCGLAGLTGWAVWRKPAAGFAGAWFFALLAPSSSFVPVATQTMAEHRMYLALAAPVVLGVLALRTAGGRITLWLGAAVGLVFVALTIGRNQTYARRLTLWADTVERVPGNARAHNNLGIELSVAGQPEAAVAQFEAALRLQPDYAEAHTNLGNMLLLAERLPEAIDHLNQAVRLKPDYTLALGNLGVALMRAGRPAEALQCYRQLLAADPADASAHSNVGYLLLRSTGAAAALPHYEQAAQLQPDDAKAQFNLAVILRRLGRNPEALARCESALRLDPEFDAARRMAAELSAEITGETRP